MLVNGVFIPLTAYLMQRFTTRELFLSAMLAFLAGSILSGVAPGFEVLLIGRLVQAAGAGIIMPLLMNVVLAIFPEEKRGGAMGIIGVAIILAPAVGPTYAGYLLLIVPTTQTHPPRSLLSYSCILAGRLPPGLY